MTANKKGDVRLQLEFETAYQTYRHTPNADTGKDLAKLLSEYVSRHPRELAIYGPVLAMVVTLRERNHWPANTWKARIGVRILVWFLNKGLGTPYPPRRPGWNDYFMMRWQLTREQRWADEIHLRTHFEDPHMVGFTAKWMASSQREQDPLFHEALCIAETKCGCVASGKAVDSR